ncbi:hypothetical protein [Saccharothrix obliqua]|uniref:hypothetical protein n=1 Tax=Saccharothrix obliqua TaxID=2861747 RepID=UPI001C5F9AAE|nr:hypothetical protein [Saccharothrix obliqua]MBW4716183.1 hypothetical protein [Saccharothrix obliqua]
MTRPPAAALFTALAAVSITIAGMVFAWSLRPPAPVAPVTAASSDELRCGSVACRVVDRAEVGQDVVEVLVGEGVGRIRTSGASGRNVFEVTIAESGAAVTDRSLECVAAEVAVCLVRGPVGEEVWGELLVRRGTAWTRAQLPYVADGAYLGLHDVDADGVADVVAVQRACGPEASCARRFAQVFSLVAAQPAVGCTAVVPAAEQLPGWPDVAPARAQLRPCGT